LALGGISLGEQLEEEKMLDTSLDDIIQTRRRGGGKGRKGGKGKGRSRSRSTIGYGRAAGGGSRYFAGGFGGGFRSAPYAGFFSRGGGGVRRSVSRVPSRGEQVQTRCYVSGLPVDWEDQDVLSVLQTVGELEKLTIYSDASGRPTGRALVQYATPQGARTAIRDLDGAVLGEKEIVVQYAGAQQGGGGGGRPPVQFSGGNRSVSRARSRQPRRQGGGGKGGEKGFWVPASVAFMMAKGSFGSWGKGSGWGRSRQGGKGRRKGGGKGKQFRRGGAGGKASGGGGKGKKKGARVVKQPMSKEELDKQMEAFGSS